MERVAIFVFDWSWNYIGHRFLTLSPAEMLKASPIARNMFARNESRSMVPSGVKDVHLAIVVTDAKDDEITSETIEEVKAVQHKQREVSHVETWEFPHIDLTFVHEKGPANA